VASAAFSAYFSDSESFYFLASASALAYLSAAS